MIVHDDFMLFIISHGRAKTIKTVKTLVDGGYTGRWSIVLDDTDSSIQEYIDRFGSDRIFIFDKNYYINSCETGTNNPSYKCTVYVKCAIEDFVKTESSIKYFVIADDDIFSFTYRYIANGSLRGCKIKDIDSLINDSLEFLISSNSSAVSYCYPSAYMSGVQSFSYEKTQKYYRIPSVFIFRNKDKPFVWSFDFGEDIIDGVLNNQVGNLSMSIPCIQVNSVIAQKRLDGGMSDNYARDNIELGMRYIISQPSCLSLKFYNGRYVARTDRNHAFPKIISGRYQR